MVWKPFIIGSTSALGATISFFIAMKFVPRLSHRKKERKIDYDKLKRDRDILIYMLYFAGMWVMWVPQRVDIDAWGSWLGIVLGILLWIVRYILLFIDSFFHRPKEDSAIYSQSNN